MEANAHQAPQPGPAEAPGLTTVKVLPSRHEEAELEFVRAFATVMDAVKQSGITNVSIVTQPLDTNKNAAASGN